MDAQANQGLGLALRATIIKLTKVPPNLPAFLNSCEDHLRSDYGVFEFFVQGVKQESTEKAYERITLARTIAIETCRARAVDNDTTFTEHYFNQEFLRASKTYEEWVKGCKYFAGQLFNGRSMELVLSLKLKTHPEFKEWMGTNPPDIHAIFKQLNTLVQGEVKLNKFTAKRNFEKSLLPKPREKLLRVDSDLQALMTTHGVTIDEEDLVNRILYDGLSCYPHIQDLLVPWRSGKEEAPKEYAQLKLMVLNHDMIRDPDSRFFPITQSVAEKARNFEPRTATAASVAESAIILLQPQLSIRHRHH